ncbi:MAG: 30S ribosomal protein S6 [Deltaproteobacteria bacterium]|nr:30S ribosomal protein S6 [Deltaproteobacteria bacterium]MBW2156325.1 30S ribosomal protein S6 [Deltaproteobacteria bacterium]MBW2198939.1 30S ribosomal protein S6 [Deltaproteobacteria bacterium]MBW2326508.1 30S ribosomal protein S6 [Deltaproteobacteria bacterium]MDX2496803.1 30S ribosomal protein S6 [Desulfobacterales bacterium]
MRRYETIFIVDNDLSEEGRSPILEKLEDLIRQYNGLQVKVDEWGTKRLAYEIKKKARGYYVCLDYCGSGPLVNEIERFFRIDDRVLKYMTVVLDKDVDIENVKEEIAKAEEAKAAQIVTSDVEPTEEPDAESKTSDKQEDETSENETTLPEKNVEEA